MATLGRSPGAAPLTTADIPDNSITSAKIVAGTVAASDVAADVATQAELDAIPVFDDNVIQTNIALLAFKTAVNGSLAKYNLQDQIVDAYETEAGVNTGDSTNQVYASGVSYSGASAVSPTVTEDADVGPTVDGDYTYYKWTDTGATGSYSTNSTQDHEYLVIAGGASGARWHGSGGGAGGYRAATGLSLVGGTTYTITVGAGGAGQAATTYGNDGNDSSISGSGLTTITSTGGGGGGYYGDPTGTAGRPGGSGGGAGPSGTSGSGAGGAGINDSGTFGTATYQGHDGGDGAALNVAGAGGGGAGAVGADFVGGSSNGGNGGIGVVNNITGADVTYAGGGGGASWGGTIGIGGSSIGGNGADDGNNDATAGTANTGSGGGGSSNDSGVVSGAGGSGIVIITYAV